MQILRCAQNDGMALRRDRAMRLAEAGADVLPRLSRHRGGGLFGVLLRQQFEMSLDGLEK